MIKRHTPVLVSVTTTTGPMSAPTFEALQQYAYKLATAVGIEPSHVRIEADGDRITFLIIDSVEYDTEPIDMIKVR